MTPHEQAEALAAAGVSVAADHPTFKLFAEPVPHLDAAALHLILLSVPDETTVPALASAVLQVLNTHGRVLTHEPDPRPDVQQASAAIWEALGFYRGSTDLEMGDGSTRPVFLAASRASFVTGPEAAIGNGTV